MVLVAGAGLGILEAETGLRWRAVVGPGKSWVGSGVTLAGSSGQGAGCARLRFRAVRASAGSCDHCRGLAFCLRRPTESAGLNGGTENDVRPNKGMKLTKLVAAPGWQAGVPLRGRAGQLVAATASQLIPSVRPTPERRAIDGRLRSRLRVRWRSMRAEQAERPTGRRIVAGDAWFWSRAQVLASLKPRQGSDGGPWWGQASLGLVLGSPWPAVVGRGQGARVCVSERSGPVLGLATTVGALRSVSVALQNQQA